MDKGIHKLALVSKLLLDKEVLHLRQENEALRLQLFWKDHNCSQLASLMEEANQASEGPQCACWSCSVKGRKRRNQETLPRGAPCTFKPWFEALLNECGLTMATGDWIGQQLRIGAHMAMNGVYDGDAHFLQVMRDDWYSWTYGARLWKAQSAEDPELAKLHALCERLGRFIYLD
jgi:hypothetical protein